MNLIQAVILAIVEGVSEFLPISSTGHLILVSHLMGIGASGFTKSFEVIIQLGAIGAVALRYYRMVLGNRRLWGLILMGTLPALLIGGIFYKDIKESLLGNPFIVVVSLVIGGLVMIFLEQHYKGKGKHIDSFDKLSWKEAGGVGLVQVLSIIPGVSRAAATILGGMGFGLTRRLAVEFSFLLAVPVMTAATGKDLLESGWGFSLNEWVLLGVGFIGAFVVAWFVVGWLVNFAQKNNFVWFGVYRIVLGIVYYLLFLRP